MYNILLKPKAVKDLNKIDKIYFSRIQKKIKLLGENPRTIGAIKLTNEEIYRVRVGNYRIIYEIFDKEKNIIISRIRHRKDVYK